MYETIENGAIIDIQGLKCCLPPEGFVFNKISKKLEYRGVYERSPIKSEQYWEPPLFPIWYKEVIKKWDDYDKKKSEDDPDFYDTRLEEIKKDFWDKRLNGMWYRNNGVATYLTGLHWFYLSVWQIDIGLPKFRIPDLEKAYFTQYCIEDPVSMGFVEVTKRRFGKSFWAGCFVTEYITRTKQANGGCQSKTGLDAKKFFAKTIVSPFRRLPKFFRPEYDMSLGVNPKTEIRFQKTNVRGKKGGENIDKDELASMIDWGSADTVHYDGQKLAAVVIDEIGKTTEVNVYDRHEVLRYTMLDSEGIVIGKMIATTTVEKLETDRNGVQDAFKLLWDESNQLKKGEDGRTPSGLYRFFMTAKRTRNFDKYGFPDEEKTLKAIYADRETVKNNPRALSARIRKEPLTIEEAFLADSDSCIFNVVNIAAQKKELTETPLYKRPVWFYRDLNGKVGWRDITQNEEHFHWKISPIGFPAKGEENKFKDESGVRKPGRTHIGAIAIDGYSNSQGGKFGSRASAAMGLRYNILDPENTGKAFGHLHGRPAVKDTLHDQVLLAAEFWGFQAYYEHNSDDYDSYFRERGRAAYLGIYPLSTIEPTKRADADRHRGFPTTPFSLTKQTDMGIAYFENHCHKIDFLEMLVDAETFDPNDRTKSDITVSLLMLIVILFEPLLPEKKQPEPLVREYTNPSYNQRTA